MYQVKKLNTDKQDKKISNYFFNTRQYSHFDIEIVKSTDNQI